MLFKWKLKKISFFLMFGEKKNFLWLIVQKNTSMDHEIHSLWEIFCLFVFKRKIIKFRNIKVKLNFMLVLLIITSNEKNYIHHLLCKQESSKLKIAQICQSKQIWNLSCQDNCNTHTKMKAQFGEKKKKKKL